MGKPLNVLLVEDSDEDVQLVVGQLLRCGWDVSFERVDTREAMTEALCRAPFDLVVSDYRMPRFSAPHALAVWKEQAPGIPFLVVSGSIGEEQAVEVLKAGAHDFFLKERLSRFGAAVERELREAENRRTLRRAELEREQALERVRRSERLFHDLFESAPDATVIVDGEGRIWAASRQAETLFGYAPGELQGQPAEVLVPPAARTAYHDLRQGWSGLVSRRLMGDGPQNLLALKKDGSTFPVEISLSPLAIDGGMVIAAVRDITARRELQEQLRQVQKMEAIGRLAGGIAHDFNNILGVILGQSQLLLRQLAEDDPRRTRAAQILQASERAAGLTRQLLTFSRSQVLETRVLDLDQVIEPLATMLARLVGEHIEIALRRGTRPCRVRADPTQLEQVLMNLAVNARDAMPNGGHLTIETSDAEIDAEYARLHPGAAVGRYVCLAVSDTGHGMSSELQARVFEPFFTTKEPGKGTGLGLATVYGIVKQSGGFVYLYSEVGLGTTFKIYLPSVEAPVEKAVAPGPVARGSETVLLVEDEAGLRELLQELLAGEGYRVLAAADPTQAIGLAGQHRGPIHMLLTDVVMPGMNGQALAFELASRRPDLRVVYMSGYTEHAIANQGVLEAGAFLLSKPFTQAALTSRIREALAAPPRGPMRPAGRPAAPPAPVA